MSMVLDAGALVALERGDRRMIALLSAELMEARVPRTHGGVVGEVWRGGRDRQARLARALEGIRVVAIDDALGRRAGELLAHTGTSDVIDAALVLLAQDGDEVYTGDVRDLSLLIRATGRVVDLVEI